MWRSRLAGAAFSPIRRVIVEGSSMEPTLAPGDRLLVVPLMRPRAGDIVAVTDPRDTKRLLVKRVVTVDHLEKAISIEGDNVAASTDSRLFGPVPWTEVLGRVVYRYAPSGRSGPIRRKVGRPL
jgi:nickel-type superoxide dismutase maturation protease